MTSYSVPDGAREWINAYSRQTKVLGQGFDLGLDWWAQRANKLPGSPVVAEDGQTSGRGRISRAYLFTLAEEAISDETGVGALRLLWPTLLWGTGDGNRNNMRRINAIAEEPQRAAILLRDAARLSCDRPRAAFETLKPKRNVISWLGPAFFTKFLYFCGGGAPDHPSLIVDKRVLNTLWRETGGVNRLLKPRDNYDVQTYLEALMVLKDWAQQLTTPERPVAPDEIERWAFEPKTVH